ncbi:basic blue protein-like [Heracleum sosnowskyi]|uniref:Basic blue protein n=1 Tax=Heracleum sosnowskyi TaxID=360622 RepID=A0AAD8IK80_9APIA|nr:basic blue protein-like [Heracleum sosnowskyi]
MEGLGFGYRYKFQAVDERLCRPYVLNFWMSKGRGSAVPVVLLVLCLVALQYEVARAAIYTVGGINGWPGWSFYSGRWPTGKSFRAGDVLVFKYNPSIHNVVAVNEGDYNSCITPQGAKVYQSGNDSIRLVSGQNFFFCSVSVHCQVGMKMAVSAI